MRRMIFAMMATTAIAFPAMAQSGTSQQDQQQNQPQASQNMQQQSDVRISAEDLNTSQVRQIQQALNKKGFDAGNVDGKWGHETSEALRNFQKMQGLSGNGDLDTDTVAALGLDSAQFAGLQSEQGHMNGQANGEENTGYSGSNNNMGSSSEGTGSSSQNGNTGSSSQNDKMGGSSQQDMNAQSQNGQGMNGQSKQ